MKVFTGSLIKYNLLLSVFAALVVTSLFALVFQHASPEYSCFNRLRYYLPGEKPVLLVNDLDADDTPEWLVIFQSTSESVIIQIREPDYSLRDSYLFHGRLPEGNEWKFIDLNNDQLDDLIFAFIRQDSVFMGVLHAPGTDFVAIYEVYLEMLDTISPEGGVEDLRIWTYDTDEADEVLIAIHHSGRLLPGKLYLIRWDDTHNPLYGNRVSIRSNNILSDYADSSNSVRRIPDSHSDHHYTILKSIPANPAKIKIFSTEFQWKDFQSLSQAENSSLPEPLFYHWWRCHDTLRLLLWFNFEPHQQRPPEIAVFNVLSRKISTASNLPGFTQIVVLKSESFSDSIHFYDFSGGFYTLRCDGSIKRNKAILPNNWKLPHKGEIIHPSGTRYLVFEESGKNVIHFFNSATGKVFSLLIPDASLIQGWPCYYHADEKGGIYLSQNYNTITGFEFRPNPLLVMQWKIYTVIFLISAISVFFLLKYRWMSTQMLTLEHKMAVQQLQTIQNQPDLHLTFNLLNTMGLSIIQADREKSYQSFIKLVKFLRLVFEKGENGMWSIDKELEISRLYLDLEKIRFPGKFEYFIEIQPEVDLTRKITSMILYRCTHLLIFGVILYNEVAGILRISVEQDEFTTKMFLTLEGEVSCCPMNPNAARLVQTIREMVKLFNQANSSRLVVDLNSLGEVKSSRKQVTIIYQS